MLYSGLSQRPLPWASVSSLVKWVLCRFLFHVVKLRDYIHKQFCYWRAKSPRYLSLKLGVPLLTARQGRTSWFSLMGVLAYINTNCPRGSWG